MKESQKKKKKTNILKIKCFSIKKNGFSHFQKNLFLFLCVVPADLIEASELLISKPHFQICNQPTFLIYRSQSSGYLEII